MNGRVRIGIEVNGKKEYAAVDFSEPFDMSELRVAVGLQVQDLIEKATEKES